jgi:glycopeptide antibiotics resistance protein
MKSLTERQVRILGSALFLVYMGGLIYFLFFAENYGRRAQGIGYRYNIVPLREIRRFLENEAVLGRKAVFLNIAGNVLGFVPFGAILPLLHRRYRSAGRVLCASLLFSAGVEIAQLLLRRGICDVDDVILNTMGGFAGYLLFACCNALRRRLFGVIRSGG